jgi:hypothetical protein
VASGIAVPLRVWFSDTAQFITEEFAILAITCLMGWIANLKSINLENGGLQVTFLCSKGSNSMVLMVQDSGHARSRLIKNRGGRDWSTWLARVTKAIKGYAADFNAINSSGVPTNWFSNFVRI